MLWFESNDLHRHLRVTPLLSERATLRASLSAARRCLSPRERQTIARAIAGHVRAAGWFRPGKRIGLYLSLPDEIPTLPLLRLAAERGCQVYLPRIIDYRARSMRFVRPGSQWRRNRFGILEPLGHETLSARWLDCIFLPALGVDQRGARLGFGAGYYDRVLAFRQFRQGWRGPRLVALVASIQVATRIPDQPHDVRSDAIVTESGIVPTDRSAA